jgi:hypothetical protein
MSSRLYEGKKKARLQNDITAASPLRFLPAPVLFVIKLSLKTITDIGNH